MKPVNTNETSDYAEFLEKHLQEVLISAVAAIYPDNMGMTREQALTLAGAMKMCGFSRDDYAAVMARSAYDKGTFAKWWSHFSGKGHRGQDAGAGTIFQYAQLCGWKWPAPKDYEGGEAGRQADTNPDRKAKPTRPAACMPSDPGATIHCIFDSVEYKSKPAQAWEIRNREPIPTPAPTPYSLQDFARAVTSGRTFYPAIYSKEDTGRRNDKGTPIYNYRHIAQQLFVVDIDNEEQYITETGERSKRRIKNYLTIEGALDICRENDIFPFFVYETFSSKQHRDDPAEPYQKFRLCFALNKPLTVQEVGQRGINAAINYFINLFGNAADKMTTDPARLIYGTDERDRAKLYGYILDSRKMDKKFFAPAAATDPGEKETDAGADPGEVAADQQQKEPQRGSIDDFLKNIQSEKYKPYETGLQFFDNLFCGGLMRGTLTILLAAPGAGKTALCAQIGEAIAEHGRPVLYLNLEMTADQMLARSISGRVAQAGVKASALDVLQGYRWTDEQLEAIIKATAEYKEKVYPNMQYCKENIGADLREIKKYLHAVGTRAINEGKEAPVFILDYLHLLTGGKDAQDTIKQAIGILKDYARNFDTMSFAISAINRSSADDGRIKMTSGRDSSGIEYTGDYILGLNYYECDLPPKIKGTDGKWHTNENYVSPDDLEAMDVLLRRETRMMNLRILKSRFAPPGRTKILKFYAPGARFYDEHDFIPCLGEQPFKGYGRRQKGGTWADVPIK